MHEVTPTVAVVGDGPAVESVRAALDDVDVPVRKTALDAIADAQLAVVVGLAGSDGFREANDRAREGDTPWIAVEVGGIGGTPVPDLDAAVSVLDPNDGCFDCLRSRVASVDRETADAPGADRSAVRVAGAYAGQLAVRAIAGADVTGTVVEVPYARRELLPAPNCACDPGRDRTIDRSVATRSLDASIDAAERAVDDRLGPITAVGEHDSFPAPYYLATMGTTDPFSDAEAPRRAAGVDVDWDRAFVKALGEALERYSAAIYRDEEFRRAPVDEVDGVSPADFVRPDDAPDPDAAGSLPWVEGVDLTIDESTWLPAEFVHFPPPEERFTTPITTGLGLGNDAVEAVLSGLYETVERDATMLGWYSTFDPLRLTVDDEGFDTLVRRARAEDLSVTPLLMTQDVDVPVVAVAVHREEWPAFAMGSAADLDAAAAARSALSEAIQNWMELRSMGREGAADAEGAIARYADFPREVRSLVDPSGAVPAESVGVVGDLDPTAELDALVDRVADAGPTPYAARVTPRDVDAIGFEAVRVLVPTAQPLFVENAFFGERARTVPRELGFEPRLDRPFHPYP
ncbi:MAG: YcaO-like family protein [Halanaeroarchaeum sp.]